MDPATIQEAKLRIAYYGAGPVEGKVPLQWFGSWVHEMGSEGTDENLQDKRQIVAGILEPHLAAADAALKPAIAHDS